MHFFKKNSRFKVRPVNWGGNRPSPLNSPLIKNL